MLKNQPTVQPTRKVAAAGLAGAVVAVVLGVTGLEFSSEVVAAIVTLLTFAVSYFVKERV